MGKINPMDNCLADMRASRKARQTETTTESIDLSSALGIGNKKVRLVLLSGKMIIAFPNDAEVILNKDGTYEIRN